MFWKRKHQYFISGKIIKSDGSRVHAWRVSELTNDDSMVVLRRLEQSMAKDNGVAASDVVISSFNKI